MKPGDYDLASKALADLRRALAGMETDLVTVTLTGVDMLGGHLTAIEWWVGKHRQHVVDLARREPGVLEVNPLEAGRWARIAGRSLDDCPYPSPGGRPDPGATPEDRVAWAEGRRMRRAWENGWLLAGCERRDEPHPPHKSCDGRPDPDCPRCEGRGEIGGTTQWHYDLAGPCPVCMNGGSS